MVGEWRQTDCADRLRYRPTLRQQHVDLSQLRDDLLGLVLLLRQFWHLHG